MPRFAALLRTHTRSPRPGQEWVGQVINEQLSYPNSSPGAGPPGHPNSYPGAGPAPGHPNSSPGAGPAPGQSRIIEFNFRFVYLVVKENINATLDGDNPSDVHWSFQQCLLGIFFVDGGLTPSLRPGPGAGCREASVD